MSPSRCLCNFCGVYYWTNGEQIAEWIMSTEPRISSIVDDNLNRAQFMSQSTAQWRRGLRSHRPLGFSEWSWCRRISQPLIRAVISITAPFEGAHAFYSHPVLGNNKPLVNASGHINIIQNHLPPAYSNPRCIKPADIWKIITNAVKSEQVPSDQMWWALRRLIMEFSFLSLKIWFIICCSLCRQIWLCICRTWPLNLEVDDVTSSWHRLFWNRALHRPVSVFIPSTFTPLTNQSYLFNRTDNLLMHLLKAIICPCYRPWNPN